MSPVLRTIFEHSEVPDDIREFFEEVEVPCGAPWVRVVERTPTQPGITGGRTPYDAHRPDGMILRAGGFGGGAAETLGFHPSCSCPPHRPVPCVVLDPFGGAATAGLAADRLRRHSVIIELNPAYIALARDRLDTAAAQEMSELEKLLAA